MSASRILAVLTGAGKQAPRLDARERRRALTDQNFLRHLLSPPVVVLCIYLVSFPLPVSQLVSSNRYTLEWGRDTDRSFPAPIPYDLLSSSRSVIFRRLMPSVDPLCSSAEVVGGSTPATPSVDQGQVEAHDEPVAAVDALHQCLTEPAQCYQRKQILRGNGDVGDLPGRWPRRWRWRCRRPPRRGRENR